MSDYVRQNDFSIKDALPSGSAQKIIKGSDVDAEFDALVVAIASKLDNISAATTGNVPLIGASGTTLTDSGKSLSAVYNQFYLATADGATGDGVTDDTTNLGTAITAAQAAGLDLVFPPGTYKITSGLTWNLSKGSFLATGHVVLDFSSMSSGDALTLNVTGTTRGTYQPWRHRVSGFTFKGPTAGATTVDGIVLDASAGYYILVENCTIYGFRDQVYMSSYAYINTFRHISFSSGTRYGLYSGTGATAGEKIVLTDCAFDGPTNAGGTGTGVYLEALTSNYVFATNTSFDYCDRCVHILDGGFFATGCHFEIPGNEPFILIESGGGGGSPCQVGLSHCTFYPGYLVTNPEDAAGRPAIIEAITDSDRVYIGIDTCEFYRSDEYDTHIVKNTAGGKIRVNFGGVNWLRGMQSNLGSVICNETNLLTNNGFETGTTDNWTVNTSPGFTWTVDGTVAHSGTYSLKAVVVAGTTNSGSVTQSIPVTPGRTLYVRWYGKGSYADGTWMVRAVYYDSAGNQINPAVIHGMGSMPGAPSSPDWTLRSASEYIPYGAAFANIQCYATPGTTVEGTFYWDDIQAWVI